MDNKEAAAKLNFGIDIPRQALHHIIFLNKVDQITELKTTEALRCAVYRYEKYWLPLAAEHPDECLPAPLDVEWVWHCHMLSPRFYETDCAILVGAVVNHQLYDENQRKEKLKTSKKYWDQKYIADNEPFDVDFDAAFNVNDVMNFKSQFTYDVISAAQRQASFYGKVSTPEYRDENFLTGSLQRYKQFLFLHTKRPELHLVPSIDVDLMWHTHQLHPVTYASDMIRLTGHLLHHDDTDTDLDEGSEMMKAGLKTKEQWKIFFNENDMVTSGQVVSRCTYRCQAHCSLKCRTSKLI